MLPCANEQIEGLKIFPLSIQFTCKKRKRSTKKVLKDLHCLATHWLDENSTIIKHENHDIQPLGMKSLSNQRKKEYKMHPKDESGCLDQSNY